MKKTRILSTILAAVMTATCLPMIPAAASAAEAEKTPIKTELISDFTDVSNWSGALAATKVEVGNGGTNTYLYYPQSIPGATRNIVFQLEETLTAETEYTIKFDAWAQIPSGTAGVRYNVTDATVKKSDGSFAANLDTTMSSQLTPTTLVFKPTKDISNTLTFNIRGDTGFASIEPKMVDNLDVVKSDGTSVATVQTGDIGNVASTAFTKVTETDYIRVPAITKNGSVEATDYTAAAVYNSDVTLTPGKYELTFDARQSYLYTDSAHNADELEYEYQKQLAAVGEGAVRADVVPLKGYREVDIDADGKRAVVPTEQNLGVLSKDISLKPEGYSALVSGDSGLSTKVHHIVYEREYEWRSWNSTYGWDTLVKVYDENDRDVKVSLAGDTDEIVSDTVNVDETWDSYTVSFEIPEGETATLSSISFGGTGKAYDNDAFDVMNASLKLVEPFIVKEVTPIESGLLIGAERNKGVLETEIEPVYDGYEKNGYISVSRLHWHWRNANSGWGSNTWLFNLDTGVAIKPSTTYSVSFKAREHVANDENTTVQAHVGGMWDVALKHTELSGEWKEFAGSFTTGGSASGNVLLNFRRGTVCQDAPVDFDDITVWIDADADKVVDEGETVIYSENYNDPDKTYIGSASKQIKVTLEGAAERFGETTLVHTFEDNYVRVADGINYTGMELDEGIYTFKADLRVPFHHHEEMRNGKNDELGYTGDYGNKEWRDPTDPAAAEAYAYNSHNLKITYTMTNGTDTKIGEALIQDAVEPTFNAVEIPVVVDAGYTLTGISAAPEYKEGANVPAANQVLDFKNADLKYVSPLRQTVVTDDAENFLNDASENYNGGIYTTVEGSGNGFITVDRRPWTWVYASELESYAWVSSADMFKLETAEDVDSDYTYFIKYDVRHTVPSSSKQYVRVQFMDTNVSGDNVTVGDTWATHQYSVNGADVSGKVRAIFRRNWGITDIPVDFDNLVIWKELTSESNGELEESDSIVYSADFDNAEENYFGINKISESQAAVIHSFDKDYRVLTGNNSDPVLTYTDLNGGEGHPEGIYTFSAEMRVPYFYFVDIKTTGHKAGWTGNDTDKLEEVYGYNKHKIDITFVLTNGEETVEKQVSTDIGFLWEGFETAVIVEKDYILTDIKLESTLSDKLPDGYNFIEFADVRLYYLEYPEVETEESEKQNYLDGKTVYMDNATYEIVEVEDPDGYLNIGERPKDNSGNTLFKIALDEAPVVGRTYYLGFKVNTTNKGETTRIRPIVNFAVEGCENLNNNYLIPTDDPDALKPVLSVPAGNPDAEDFSNPSHPDHATYLKNNSYYQVSVDNTERYFEGQFTASKETAAKIVISVNRGPSANFCQAVTVDDIAVWYLDDDGAPVYMLNEDFNSTTVSSDISAYDPEFILPVSHMMYTPMDASAPMTLTYDVVLTEEEAVEGTYHFHTIVKLAETSENAAAAVVAFNYADGSSVSKYVELSDEWSVVAVSAQLDKNTKLESVSLMFISDVGVQLRAPLLDIRYKYEYGRPNWGIVMVLLKKKDGGMTDPWKQVGIN